MDRNIVNSAELRIPTPEAMLEIATLNEQFKLEAPDNIPQEEKLTPQVVPQEADQEKPGKTSVLDRIRSTKLSRAVAVAGTVIALATAGSIVKDTVSPVQASGALVCQEESYVDADGVSHSSKECHYEENPAEESPSETEDTAPSEGKKKPSKPNHENETQDNAPKHGGSIKQPKDTDKKHHKFIDFDQPTGNTCYSASFAMIAATLNDNPKITPMKIATSKQIRPHFSLSGGVKGHVYKTINALANRFKLKVSPKRSGFGEAKSTLRKGGLSMVLYAGPSHFASSNGHFNVLKRLKNGRFIIADPNGAGRSGDSERKKGWTAGQLKAGGAIGVWNFTKKPGRRGPR